MTFELMVAVRYLRAKRKDGFISVITWLSLIGIMLGVAVLIVVMSVMNGFREKMLESIMGMNGHVVVMPEHGRQSIGDYSRLADRIADELRGEIPFRPVPMVESQVMVASEGASAGVILRAMDMRDMALLKPLVGGLLDGRRLGDVGRGEVLVGYKLANSLGVGLGGDVSLTTARGNVTAFGTVPRTSSYGVGAAFKTGMSVYDANFIFMDLPSAQLFANMEGRASHIEIFLNDPDGAGAVAERLSAGILRGHRLYTWLEQNSSFVSALSVERNVMFLILTLIILVASFNIISSLVMLVKDKARDIAVFRTLGATKASVMRIFFLAGSIIGVLGTVLGALLGVAVSLNIEYVRKILQFVTGAKLFPDDVYFLSELPSSIDSFEVSMVVAMSMLIAFLATIYPSLRAARQEPVEVLRYE
ncbi:MAG: lipoprotein-releasing ABC transporter permease subunit [Rickettsiales bacterium]|jgi:lipoprotein-releasing system permease protein|nr:lipoprotein-releasing ABC transporter permease subunit [Rickettsiales bacterium]